MNCGSVNRTCLFYSRIKGEWQMKKGLCTKFGFVLLTSPISRRYDRAGLDMYISFLGEKQGQGGAEKDWDESRHTCLLTAQLRQLGSQQLISTDDAGPMRSMAEGQLQIITIALECEDSQVLTVHTCVDALLFILNFNNNKTFLQSSPFISPQSSKSGIPRGS